MLFQRKKRSVTISEVSNTIQFDDMGYPLLLCIMSDGSQQWIDVDYKWAIKEKNKGKLCVLKWVKEYGKLEGETNEGN